MHTGEDFPIFQDRTDIGWGDNWRDRIEDSLDAVTFLIPILTPSFFKSPACRDELERFLDREKKLKRADLVLPVYYVDCPVLNDRERRKEDPLAQVLAERQYEDWRDLRFVPYTSAQGGRTFAALAVQIRDALERADDPARARGTVRARRAAQPPPGTPVLGTAQEAPEIVTEQEEGPLPDMPERTRGPREKIEPPTLVVDPMHHGDHTTISAAIAAANPGDRILVRPGLYAEGLVVDKPLVILGDGPLEEIVVQATEADAVLFKTTMGHIANLTLRQMGGGNWHGVDITGGRLVMEGCDVTSQSLVCIAIRDGADPLLRYNRIHGSRSSGVFVYGNGQGTLEDNDIFDNALAGVAIRDSGNPVLRGNRLHGSGRGGVYVFDNGRGALEDNDIFDNVLAGVAIREDGNPMLRRNRIHDGRSSGVFVDEGGQGTLEDNDIFGNAHAGVESQEGGKPTLRRNRINRNGRAAIQVSKRGAVTAEDNDLRDNARGAWDISSGSESQVTRRRNLE